MIAQLMGARHDRMRVIAKQCAWCCAVEIGGRYVRLPGVGKLQWIMVLPLPQSKRLVLGLSHGVCPECAQRVSRSA